MTLGLVDDVPASLLRVQDRDPRILDQREEVTIAADDLDLPIGLGGPGGDDVLGFVVGHAGSVDPDRGKELVDDRHLRDQSGRDRLRDALRLVARDQRHPPVRSPVRVTRHREVTRIAHAERAGQGLEEAADRIDGPSVGRADTLRNAVVGAKDEAGSVDEQPVAGHPPTFASAAGERLRPSA